MLSGTPELHGLGLVKQRTRFYGCTTSVVQNRLCSLQIYICPSHGAYFVGMKMIIFVGHRAVKQDTDA